LLCGHQAGEALVPVLVGVVIDRAVATGDVGALVAWLAVLALDFAFLSLCYRYGARRAWLADVLADQRLRHLVADRVLDPAGGADAGRLPGELTAIAVADAKRVGVAHFAIPMGLAAIAALVVAAIALLRTSVPLGLLILLGTGVALLSQRDPIHTAKEVASLDLVSDGRAVFGVGVGWNREEMADHGTDPAVRGRLVDERLAVVLGNQTDDFAVGTF